MLPGDSSLPASDALSASTDGSFDMTQDLRGAHRHRNISVRRRFQTRLEYELSQSALLPYPETGFLKRSGTQPLQVSLLVWRQKRVLSAALPSHVHDGHAIN